MVLAERGYWKAEQPRAFGHIGGGVCGDPVLHRRPGIVADGIRLDERRNGVDVVRA